MKFYYNNKLIRTSKTHNYKYAVITASGRLLCCASSYDLALKGIQTNTGTQRSNLDFYKKELDALNKGLNSFYITNRWGCNKFKVEHTREQLESKIMDYEKWLQGIQIVELEAKD